MEPARLRRTRNTPDFPASLPEPGSYYTGVDDPERPRVRNVLVFMRTERDKLQQRNFANRSHHRHVLILALDTAGSVIVDGSEVRLGEGQGMLVRPFQFHHYINLEQDRLRWLFVTFDLEAGGGRLPELDYRVLRPDENLLRLWSRIARTWGEKTGPERAVVLPLLDLLLTGLLAGERTVTPAGAGNSSWIARTESLLIQSIYKGWTVEEIASQLGLSGRRLRTLFEEQTGVSIRRYRANYQLHRAMQLMSGSSDSLSRIAERCGFNSLSVFTRFIQRETGQPPRRFRRTLE
ncbi:helix-turn-helix transcriptional regulator [Ruficoccus amylovorans]|uniref:Helix-turn-helix transcriptional regulator n=1 Tax=Ruficoccus amylovorans TaxID=1804625 RepID=A0A842HA39_9BACT|nr:AraC family transcriptional regulator [Ruficoccus amylovorans]MBC2593175.1 helix-turn-helix transcriptional regulator [Ruficoccus amylovorans]